MWLRRIMLEIPFAFNLPENTNTEHAHVNSVNIEFLRKPKFTQKERHLIENPLLYSQEDAYAFVNN